ncbi:isoleucine--tRNA ligase [Buchnera aphidicola]|uniref:isoleucine--tRNA ligase n=1 Tax=Buchnera aphidicola TaxID=9 RepID=UPI0034646CF6
MKSYQNTLNLPKTNFPMRGNLSEKEPVTLNKWKKNNIYQQIRKKNEKKPNFIIHDGPPYANGNIHIGHAINKILKDIITKSKTLCGFNTPYTPFWDCHGLPIEHQIEKQFGKPGDQITKEKFRQMCKEYVIQQVKKQKKDFIRLGIFGDWENAQLTMQPNLESNVIKILGKIIENKYLYQGFKPVHWCIKCQSALAEAEVEYDTKKTKSIIVLFSCFQLENLKKIFSINIKILAIYISIWTTTPWSIPANRAIAVHPNFQYQLICYKKKYVIIAKKLVVNIMKKIKITKWKVCSTIYGHQLEHLQFIHPFLNNTIPIILSTHVTLDAGTGAVHIAPDHGEEDYLISRKYKIPIANIIDHAGNYINNIHDKLNYLNIFKSEKIIIELIQNNNLLLCSENLYHSYPHCWRHKTPIIYRTTKQWFIKVQNKVFKKNILNDIKKVKWIPDWGYNRMHTMIENRPDWCISRQRVWGVPITVFLHKKTNQLHPETTNIFKIISNLIKLHGIEIWWKIDKKEILGKDYQEYKKSKDILDVWFESGCINNTISSNKKNKINNLHMYLEGSDQYRGWFMSSIIISKSMKNILPFQTVLTHGFAVDHLGKKMSKSIGNVITPIEIIKKFGADVLRLWTASTNYTSDIIISDAIIKQISDYYRRIRNTSRFLLSNINDFDPYTHTIDFSKMLIIDQWILNRTKKIQEKIIILYQNYKFHKVVKKIMQFCSIELGSFYLEIIKDRQYTLQKNSIERKSCQTALYYILHALVRWITPILPFTADEIWEYIPGKHDTSIFIEEWFRIPYNILQKNAISNENWIKLYNLRIEINKIIELEKKKKNIKNSLESSIILYVKNDFYKLVTILAYELKFLFLVSKVTIQKYQDAPIKSYKNKNIQDIKILIQKYFGIKCPRCWNYYNHIYIKNVNKEICNRCNKNIYENGEKRKFI